MLALLARPERARDADLDRLPADALRPPARARGDRPAGRRGGDDRARDRRRRLLEPRHRRRSPAASAAALAAVATCPYPLRLRYDRGTLREYFHFSWPLLAASASGLVVVQGSVLIGNFTVGLAGLGALGLASTFSMFADRLDALIRRTIYPAVCAVKDRTALLFEAFVKSNRLALMWAFPFGVGLALFAARPDHLRARRALARGRGPAAGVRADHRLPPGRLQLGDLLHRASGETRPMAVSSAVAIGRLRRGHRAADDRLRPRRLRDRGWRSAVVVDLARPRLLPEPALRAASTSAATWRARSRPACRRRSRSSPCARSPTPSARSASRSASSALYVVLTVLSTLIFERALLGELFGYLRRGCGRPRRPGSRAPAGLHVAEQPHPLLEPLALVVGDLGRRRVRRGRAARRSPGCESAARAAARAPSGSAVGGSARRRARAGRRRGRRAPRARRGSCSFSRPSVAADQRSSDALAGDRRIDAPLGEGPRPARVLGRRRRLELGHGDPVRRQPVRPRVVVEADRRGDQARQPRRG